MIDKKTMETLAQVARGISKTFGTNCEVAIHSVGENQKENSIISIENGHVSGRKVGDNLPHDVLKVYTTPHDQLEDKYDFLTNTEDGRVLRSSTMYIRDENEKIGAVMAISYDVTELLMARRTILNLIDFPKQEEPSEKISRTVNDLLDDLIDQSLKISGKPVAMMDKEDKIKAISFLNEAGAFLITKSGDKVSNFFGISKYTLYNYLDKGI